MGRGTRRSPSFRIGGGILGLSCCPFSRESDGKLVRESFGGERMVVGGVGEKPVLLVEIRRSFVKVKERVLAYWVNCQRKTSQSFSNALIDFLLDWSPRQINFWARLGHFERFGPE